MNWFLLLNFKKLIYKFLSLSTPLTASALKSRLAGYLGILALVLIANSCAFYTQDLMFRTETLPDYATAKKDMARAEANYIFQKDDWVSIQVYTNKGELIIDPNFEMMRSIGGGQGMMGIGMMQGGAGGQGGGGQGMMGGMGMINTANMGRYLVNSDGTVTLPMVGTVKISGLTYRQADSILVKKYSLYYEEPFVMIRSNNRRAFVFMGTGSSLQGAGQSRGLVVPLMHENMNLIEVLAYAGGLGSYSPASKIRLLRGDLKNPKVQIIDLSTVDGMRAAELVVLPNDIIYVDPARRPGLDLVRDLFPLISLPLSLVSVILVLTR